jgi:flagellar hook protein FlgE
MAAEVSTIQSLKAVDAWIDVINANINGGVRTAFKASRLKFAGSNPNVDRAGNAVSLPLQFPEPGLTTANTVIDFSQGAVTGSTENSHLAIQGDGFFLLADPATVDASTGLTVSNPNARFLLTRDGEFRTGPSGLMIHVTTGYYLMRYADFAVGGVNVLRYDTGAMNGAANAMRAIYNDLDVAVSAASPQRAFPLSGFAAMGAMQDLAGLTSVTAGHSLCRMLGGKDQLQYSAYGATVFDFGFQATAAYATPPYNVPAHLQIGRGYGDTNQILTKSLEASNASMTQSVPELSLAQKLFSALTKVLQTKQTNVDGVLNLVR